MKPRWGRPCLSGPTYSIRRNGFIWTDHEMSGRKSIIISARSSLRNIFGKNRIISHGSSCLPGAWGSPQQRGSQHIFFRKKIFLDENIQRNSAKNTGRKNRLARECLVTQVSLLEYFPEKKLISPVKLCKNSGRKIADNVQQGKLISLCE